VRVTLIAGHTTSGSFLRFAVLLVLTGQDRLSNAQTSHGAGLGGPELASSTVLANPASRTNMLNGNSRYLWEPASAPDVGLARRSIERFQEYRPSKYELLGGTQLLCLPSRSNPFIRLRRVALHDRTKPESLKTLTSVTCFDVLGSRPVKRTFALYLYGTVPTSDADALSYLRGRSLFGRRAAPHQTYPAIHCPSISDNRLSDS